ncbi:MAG TPA: hypothetical protein DEA70_00720, partial [Acidimicrobiaceae bacterium]|nr:hypothetical protein [Acidimicrobiaceae bacterium]
MRALILRWALPVLILALVTASCGDDGDTQQVESSFTPPRTYEDLDLSGPEAAVAEFISAFVRRDYIAAALILHPDAQRAISASVAENDLTGLITPNAEPAVVARLAIERNSDHLLDGMRVFEMAMEETMANGGFIVDLASGAEGLTLRSSDQFGAVVEGILSTNGNDVVFELAPTSDERWRIRSARLTNGTPL